MGTVRRSQGSAGERRWRKAKRTNKFTWPARSVATSDLMKKGLKVYNGITTGDRPQQVATSDLMKKGLKGDVALECGAVNHGVATSDLMKKGLKAGPLVEYDREND